MPQPDYPLPAVPLLQISVELHPRWMVQFKDTPPDMLLKSQIGVFLTRLGLPADLSIEFRPASIPDRPFPEDIFYLALDGLPLHYPSAFLARASQFTAGEAWLPALGSSAMLSRLEALDSSQSSFFLSTLVMETLKLHRAALLTSSVLEAYRNDLRAGWQAGDLPNPDWLKQVLSQAMEQRIFLEDQSRVAACLQAVCQQGLGPDAAAEALVMALSAGPSFALCISRPTLEGLTQNTFQEAIDYFSATIQSFSDGMGNPIPPLQLIFDPSLPDWTYTFRLNDLDGFAWRGPKPDQVFTNDTPDRLKLVSIEGSFLIDPATSGAYSLVSREEISSLREIGLQAWDGFVYLAYTMAHELRFGAACLLSAAWLESQLNTLRSSQPDLVEAIQSRFSSAQILRTLRLLLAEGFPITGLERILQVLLEFDYNVCADDSRVVLESRLNVSVTPSPEWLADPVNLAAYLRNAFEPRFSSLAAHSQTTLVCHVAGAGLEERLANSDALSFEAHWQRLDPHALEDILWAVRRQVEATASAVVMQSIVISGRCQPALRRLLAPVLPEMAILSYAEIDPSLNIQPIDTIDV